MAQNIGIGLTVSLGKWFMVPELTKLGVLYQTDDIKVYIILGTSKSGIIFACLYRYWPILKTFSACICKK